MPAPPADWLASVRRQGGASRDRSGHDDAWQRRAECAEQRVADLEHSMTSRTSTDQAAGVIMAVFGLDAGEAHEVLSWCSRHGSAELADLARRLLLVARTS